ncbi:MAG: tetratricopeptide repeat protein [Planctomycetota bacterium]|jgi:tetratricopeptide (TPR) repeat protein
MQARPSRGKAAHLVLPAATGLGGLALGFLVAQFAGSPASTETLDGPLANGSGEAAADTAEAVEATAGNALTPTATPASANNEEVPANATPTGARREAVLPTADELAGLAESDPELFQELQAFLRSGNLEGLLADNPIGARQFLLSLYLQTGNPLDALDLVQRSEDLPSGSWIQVADALQGQYPDKAAFAIEQGIRAQIEHGFSWDWPFPDWFQRLATMDAGRALAILEEHRATLDPIPPAVQQLWAQVLGEGGRREEARGTLMDLLQDPNQASQALRQLAELDPQAAEAELRSRLANNENPGDLRQQLMSLLIGQGRTEEALELLEGALDAGGGDINALLGKALGELPPEVVAEHLEDWMSRANSNDQGLWNTVAQHLLNAGDLAGATEHFMEGWERSANASGNWLSSLPEELLEHDPGAVLQTLDRLRDVAGTRDELWGDIADHYWRLGQTELARDAWARASEIDPGDGEWTGKLSKYDQGINPVGGSKTPSGFSDSTGSQSTEKPPQANPFFNANPFGGGGNSGWGGQTFYNYGNHMGISNGLMPAVELGEVMFESF